MTVASRTITRIFTGFSYTQTVTPFPAAFISALWQPILGIIEVAVMCWLLQQTAHIYLLTATEQQSYMIGMIWNLCKSPETWFLN